MDCIPRIPRSYPIAMPFGSFIVPLTFLSALNARSDFDSRSSGRNDDVPNAKPSMPELDYSHWSPTWM